MANKDTFEGVKAGITMFDALLLGVAEEIGTERALALQSKVMEKIGTMQGKAIKKQVGDKKFDAKSAGTIVNPGIEKYGLTIKVVEDSPKRVLTKCTECTYYAAGHDLGIDNKTIEMFCRVGGIKSVDALVKQLNPKLSARVVKFRSSPEDFCEEEIALE